MAGLLVLVGLALVLGFVGIAVAKAMPQSSSRMGSDTDSAGSFWAMSDSGSQESSHDCSHDGDGGCDGGGD